MGNNFEQLGLGNRLISVFIFFFFKDLQERVVKRQNQTKTY